MPFNMTSVNSCVCVCVFYSAATLMMLGDVISQQVVENRGFKHHDWPRSGRMAFIGLIYIVSERCLGCRGMRGGNDCWQEED